MSGRHSGFALENKPIPEFPDGSASHDPKLIVAIFVVAIFCGACASRDVWSQHRLSFRRYGENPALVGVANGDEEVSTLWAERGNLPSWARASKKLYYLQSSVVVIIDTSGTTNTQKLSERDKLALMDMEAKLIQTRHLRLEQ